MKRPPARPKVDHELRVGALAHYEDATYYARAYRDRHDDVAFYVGEAIANGGPVLEYGCGSGRITLPMARAGVEVFGVDWSEPMLAALDQALLAEAPTVRARVKTRRGDMREVRINRKFPLVFATFNVVLHLYDRHDLARFLARVRGHLAPGGRLVFDTSTPFPSDLARDPSRAYTMRPFVHPTRKEKVRYAERFDYDPLRQILFVSMEFTPERGEPFVTPLAHRQWFPAELEAMLHYEGFEVLARAGGFSGEPLDANADVIVWTARPKRRAR